MARRIILFVFLLHTPFIAIQANEPSLSLNFKNATLKQILNSIENNSKYVFIYNNDLVDDTKKYSINIEKSELSQIAKELFNNSDIQFRVVDYYVFLNVANKNITKSKPQLLAIEGNVLDDYKQVLPGVSVLNSANILRAVTDLNGSFRINANPADSLLTFYLMGFKKHQVSVNSGNIEVVLKNNSILLNDLLVVGYGTIKTKEMTGSVVSLKPELLNKTVGGDITSSFQGNVAGVYTQNDRIRIRGVSSLNSSSDAFLVVDGVPQYIALKDLNPDDIESVEVLKDASSGAIYGSRAANGVILVTTKSGKLNTAMRLTVNFKTGINFLINKPEYLVGANLLQVLDDAYYNKYPDRKALAQTNTLKYFPFSPDYTNYQGYNRSWVQNFLTNQPSGENWLKAVSQPMNYNDIRMSFQGGQSQNKYLVSLSYRKNNDLIRDKSNDRWTLLLKNEYNMKPWATFGLASNMVLNSSKNSTYPSFSQIISRSSLLPVYAPNNSAELFDARNINDKKGTNPLYQIQETWDDNVEINELFSSFIAIKLHKTLTFRSDWSLNFGTRRYRYFQSKDYYREDEAIDPTKSGIIMYARTLNYGINGNNTLSYKSDFSKSHSLKVMFGNNIQSYNSDFNVARFEGFPTDYFQLTNANTEKVYTRQSAGMDGYRFVSFFNRTQYSFNEKLFAEVNARVDGTSRFEPGKRWGFFPGMGLSWIVSEESFLKNNKFIDYLKLRSSLGMVGNAEMGNFPSQSRALNWGEYAGSPGFVFDKIANPDVSWEKQTQLNAGFNFSTCNNRLVIDFDWFYKLSNDLLINYNIGVFQGYFTTDVTLNTGKMSNKGFDLNIRSNNLTGKLSWKTDLNISSFKTNVLKLSTQQDYIERGVNRVYEGYPLALYFLPLSAGIDPTTGHELIYEVTGPENDRQKTGNLLDAELMDFASYNKQRVLITDKTPYPDFYGGITNSFNYKNWELSFLLSFQTGNWYYQTGVRQASYVTTYDIQNKLRVLNDYWTPENTNGKTPLLYNSQMASRENDRFLVDGSYIRLRNLMLSYNLPEKLMTKFHLKSTKLIFQAQNLFTFTKLQNGDPEISTGTAGSTANIAPGNIGLNYGVMTLNLGLSIEL